jgi:hypothetical protein
MDAPIFRVALASQELGRFERLDDPRHRRRPNLLACCELAQRPRTAEDEHRERRQLGGRNAGRRIFTADVPQRMDRRRVEAVGGVG